MTINEREIVLDMLLNMEKQESYSHLVLRDTLRNYQYLPKASRSFITRLLTGTLEYRHQIDWELNHYSKVKVHKMKPVIRELLRMGVYQILYMDQVPDSAACNEAVKLAGKRGFASLKGFVNGILRNVAREKDHLPQPAGSEDSTAFLSWKYSMPEWLVEEWKERFGTEETEQMLAAFLAERPVTIRCNENKITPEALADRLLAEGAEVKSGHFLPQAMELSGFDYLNSLESFEEGMFLVQDESSMLVGLASGVGTDSGGDRNGSRSSAENSDAVGLEVLDLCAAPGGKSLFLAELAGDSGHVTARDLTEAKVSWIAENAERYGADNLTAECHDARVFDESWRERADVVIADLPCSGLGVIGRKTDIKYRIQPSDLTKLAALQREILTAAREYVKPGGVLLYSTCTISPEENEENVKWMEREWPEFRLEPLFTEEQLKSAPDKEAAKKLFEEGKKGYLQLIPGAYPTDGFFLAKFRKEVE